MAGQAFPQSVREPRAGAALGVGILSLLLIWPFGPLLGPLAVVLGLGALRRIDKAAGRLIGRNAAIAGVATGGVTCGFYGLVVIAELASILLFGQLMPAY